MTTEKDTFPDIAVWLNSSDDNMLPMQLAILDAAAQAFTTLGYAAASVDLIASQIGATKGSVYYHYRSKGDLFFAVHKRAMAMNLKTLYPLFQDPDLSPEEKLLTMTYQHALTMMNHLYYQRVTVQGVELHQSASTTPAERVALAEVLAMRDAYESMFVQVLKDGVARKAFADADCRLSAKGILGALNWITVWYRPREEEALGYREKVAGQFSRQAVQGVLALAR